MSQRTDISNLLKSEDELRQEDWTLLIEVYTKVVHGIARSMGLAEQPACDVTDDVMSDVVLKIQDGCHKHKNGRFRAWMKTVAKHSIINYFAKLKSQKHQMNIGKGGPDPKLAPDANIQIDSVLEQLEQKESAEFAKKLAIKQFGQEEWDMFVRKKVDKHTWSEIADTTNRTVDQVRYIVGKIQKFLKSKIDL